MKKKLYLQWKMYQIIREYDKLYFHFPEFPGKVLAVLR